MSDDQVYLNDCPRCGCNDMIRIEAAPVTHRMIEVAVIECRYCNHFQVGKYLGWHRHPFTEVIEKWNSTPEDGTI